MPNVSDEILDSVVTHTINLLRVAAGQRKDVLAMLEKLEGELLGNLQAVAGTAFNAARLKALLSQTSKTITSAYKAIADSNGKALSKIAALEATKIVNVTNNALGVAINSVGMSAEQLAAIAGKTLINGKYPKEHWKDQEATLANQFAVRMRDGMLRGEGIDKLVARVRGTKANAYTDGLMAVSKAQATALVRTSIISTANEARIQTMLNNQDTIKGIQWVSTLDSRTTPTCFGGETLVAPLGKIRAIFRRAYNGDFVVITTATGKQIAATPNHPVLTSMGWLPADELKPSEHVVYSSATNGLCIKCSNKIGVPPTFAELADTLFDPALSDVLVERTTAEHFHGDGQSVNDEVYIARPKSHLVANIMSGASEQVSDKTLRWLSLSQRFDAGRLFDPLAIGRLPLPEASEIHPGGIQDTIQPGFTAPHASKDFSGASSGVEQLDSPRDFSGGCGIVLATLERWHHAKLLEQCRESGGADIILSCQCCGRLSATVSGEDIVSVRRENRACHVYNVETYCGDYMAGGIIVKNCRALDGLEWALPDFKPVGHNKTFPGPTAHFNCRSTQIPVTRSWKELAGPNAKFKDAEGNTGNVEQLIQKRLVEMGMSPEQAAKYKADTRASMDGQVAGKLNFEDWLAKKSAAFQDDLLGPQRAEMWRTGNVTIAEMTNQDNRPLTISELKTLVASNTNIVPSKEGENGLSLLERKLLEQSMVAGAETKDVLTHFVDGVTGTRVTITGTSPAADDLDKIKGFGKLQVLQNSLSPGEVWGQQQFGLFGALPNFHKASIVGPTGRVFSVTVKAGAVFDSPAATDLFEKFKALKNTKTIPQTQQKFVSAVAQNGTLKTSLSPAGAVALPPKTFNQVFSDLVQKPAPFFEPEVNAAKKVADDAKKAAADALAAKQKIADDIAVAKRAAEMASNTEATAARAAAYKAQLASEAADAEAAKLAEQVTKANAEASAEIADVIANPTGKQLLAKNLAKLMKEKPELQPHELLPAAKAQAILDQSKASQSAALSGYKKKILEGKEPTPAQKKAFADLDPDGQFKFGQSVAAAKTAQLKKAADEAAAIAGKEAASLAAVADSKPIVPLTGPATSSPLPIPKGFPEDPANLEVVKGYLGGSTGAQLVKDKAGNLFVRKTGASPAHIREEAFADAIYRALGVDVPEFQLYETPLGPVKLARFVEGKQLGEYLKTAKPKQREAVLENLRKGFAADVVLGNWDVAGAGFDNLLVRPDGSVVRIDNGGSLRFRATGPLKTPTEWNDYATELWTMRGLRLSEKDTAAKLSAQTTELFGAMTIYDVARLVETIDPAAFRFAPAEVRQVLEQRFFHMQVIATRALDFERTEWKAATADNVARHSMGLRENGTVERMSKKFTGKGGPVLVDEHGKEFDELRSTRGPGGVNVQADDPYAHTFLQAIISINAHKKKASGDFANTSKVKAVTDLWTQLTLESTGTDKAKAELAKYYLGWLEKIEDTQKKFKAGTLSKVAGDPLPKFENGAGTAIVLKHKAPGTQQKVKPNQSLTADVSDYIASEGGTAEWIREWMSGQAGSSWSNEALPLKYWAGKNHGTEKFWWGTRGEEHAKAAYDKLAKTAGGAEKLDKIFSMWVAYTQEVLTNTAMPNKDDTRRLVRLIRTELDGVLTESGIKEGKYGGVHTMKKGAAESHSFMQITSVYGAETTVQAVPFVEVYGMYLTERPGYGTVAGSAGPGFYGEGENEFVANSSNYPFVYAGKATGTGYPLAIGAPGWKEKLMPGYDAGNDASKWGVPIDFWKP